MKEKEQGRVKPKAGETPCSKVFGGEPFVPVPFSAVAAAPPIPSASGEPAGYEAHLLEISTQPSVAITAAGYAGLRGRAIPADFLRAQPVEVPTDWASQVKEGHVYWMHYDGLREALQDKLLLKGFGKWARWQQRRGLFWSIALPRWSTLRTNATVRALATLPAVHRIRGRDSVILTNAPWLRKSDLVSVVRYLGRQAEELALQHPDSFEPLALLQGPVRRIRIVGAKRLDPLDPACRRAKRAAEEQATIGGLRDSAASVAKLDGWSSVGRRINAALDSVLRKRTVEVTHATYLLQRGIYNGPSLECTGELYLELCRAFSAPACPSGTRGPFGILLAAIFV